VLSAGAKPGMPKQAPPAGNMLAKPGPMSKAKGFPQKGGRLNLPKNRNPLGGKKAPGFGAAKGGGKLKMPFGGKKFGRGGKMGKMRGGKGGDVAGAVEGAINIADGMARITGKKEAINEAATKAATGTRNRNKAAALFGYALDTVDKKEGQVWDNWMDRKDFLVGGWNTMKEVDREWDEREAAEDEYRRAQETERMRRTSYHR